MVNYGIRDWALDAKENVSVGDFSNVENIEKFGVFPGKFEGDSVFRVENDKPESIKKIPFIEEDYLYFHKGDGYFYGITKNSEEIIAIVDEDDIIPVTSGAGGYVFEKNGERIFNSKKMIGYSVSADEGYPAVTVNYEAEGRFRCAVNVANIYTFKERSFSVDAVIRVIGLEDGVDSAYFVKSYLNDYKSFTKKVAFKWEYPENNDFAFKNFDAVVTSENYGEYSLLTAIRDKNADGKVFIRAVETSKFEVYPQIKDEFEYICHIDYAVTKSDEKEFYKGLFLTKNNDFAAGIASVNETDNTTFFMGHNLHLNLNVTNISNSDINFTAKYELLDYNGKCIEEKTSYSNKLSAGNEANRNIKLNLNDYGMYWLNFYVTTENYEYRETYPFAMIEEFEFKYRDQNRMGICATHTETLGEARSAAKICGKIGLSVTRDGRSAFVDKLHEYLRENGVKKYSGVSQDTQDPAGIVWAKTPDDIDRMMEEVKMCDANFADENCEFVFIANEVDAPAKANYEKSYKLLTEEFIPNTYKPIYNYISEKFPNSVKKMIWQSNCHGTSEWLEAFYDTGMWDNSAIIDIHTYSSPSGPDKVYSNMRESMHANTFSNEYAMDRWKRIKKRYGEKRMMVGETGYPAAAYIGNRCEVDPRTVADFNVRIAMFLLEAGAEYILYYSIFDRTRNFIGASPWNEMYFGACYNYDYYGVYQPKPWAAAYANLTRRIDGHKRVSYFDKYEQGEFGDLRAFKVETETDEFAVVWSNKYKQPNTTAVGRVNKVERIPMPLWENRWIESDIREFDAVGDTVTVIDIMGNSKEYKAQNGKVTIEVTGSPIYVYGIY